MSKVKFLVLLVLVLCVTSQLYATIFENGGISTVDYSISEVIVKDSASNLQTTVNIVDGADVYGFLSAKDNSIVNISGGHVAFSGFRDNATANISGGTLSGDMDFGGNASLNISGGEFGDNMIIHCVGHSGSQVEISGGTFNSTIIANVFTNMTITGGEFLKTLDVYEAAQVTIAGTDFEINGESFSYGEYSFDNWTSIDAISGTFLNGQSFNIDVELYKSTLIGANLILTPVPEPATFMLFGLSALILRKRK